MNRYVNTVVHCLTREPGTISSEQRRTYREQEQDQEAQPDPETFAFTTSVGRPPIISWQNNLTQHLAVDGRLTFSLFLTFVHPQWLDQYLTYCSWTYKMLAFNIDRFKWNRKPYTVRFSVPLLNADQKYYWYEHTVSAGFRNDAGIACAYMNRFRYLGRYDLHLPRQPLVAEGKVVNKQLSKQMHEAMVKVTMSFLDKLFSPAIKQWLLEFRKCDEIRRSGRPNHVKVMRQMKCKPYTYKQNRQRTKNYLAKKLEDFPAGNALLFARWLNYYFPDEK